MTVSVPVPSDSVDLTVSPRSAVPQLTAQNDSLKANRAIKTPALAPTVGPVSTVTFATPMLHAPILSWAENVSARTEHVMMVGQLCSRVFRNAM